MNAQIVVAAADLALQSLIVETLQQRGHQVLGAASGDTALELIGRTNPALLVLDSSLRGTNGATVAQTLAADAKTAGLPTVILIDKAEAANQRAWLGAAYTTAWSGRLHRETW